MRPGGHFSINLLDEKPGIAIVKIHGKGASDLIDTEPGGHRWQESSGKKGNIHTSTITIAVLKEESKQSLKINPKDLRVDFYRASGAGGQHRNKTDSACRVTHLPTGTVSKSENERSQHINKDIALESLHAKLQFSMNNAAANSRSQLRKDQVGSGMRGDKIRTIRTQDDTVINHITGEKSSLKSYLKGDF